MGWVVDLDGVVWLGEHVIPGAPEALARLQRRTEVVFVTNNSSRRISEYEDRLGSLGVAAAGMVLSSASAAAALVAPGERALVCGGPGLFEALAARGAEVVDATQVASRPTRLHPPAEVVVMGFQPAFDYALLGCLADAVRAGARLVASNTDATYPVRDGLRPGTGALVAAVATASGCDPQVAGKPHRPLVDLVRERLGSEAGVVVGDRPDTDGAFAQALGYRFALVLSGVTDAAGAGAGDLGPRTTVVADLAGAVDGLG